MHDGVRVVLGKEACDVEMSDLIQLHSCHVDETATETVTDRVDRLFVRRVCRQFLRNLRAIYVRVAPEMAKRFPKARKPCHSCAFNPSTDRWQGMESTAWKLAQAIRHDQPFYCHENLPYMRGFGWIPVKKKLRLCASWATIMNDPAVKTAFEKAAVETKR